MIFDGNALQAELQEKLTADIAALHVTPSLTILLVGDDPRSKIYVQRKKIFGQRLGCRVRVRSFPQTVRAETVRAQITAINHDARVHGCILQLPLPKQLSLELTLEITPEKDVDGLGKNAPFTPATARAIMTILRHAKIPLKGERAVVVGRSALVGAPTAELLRKAGAEVTVCHSHTKDLLSATKNADILISAVGKKHLIRADTVKKGSVVINVGITYEHGIAYGDVHPDVAKRASFFTPVVGGVGPITVAMLFQNLVDAVRRQADSSERKVPHS